MARSGNHDLVATMFATHGRRLIRFFSATLPDAAEARDLAHEVYLRLLRVDQPDLIRCPEAYLFTVAANIRREYAIRRARQPVHVTLDSAVSEELPDLPHTLALPDPEVLAMRAAEVHRLERILGSLTPRARAALIWHRRDGLSYEEIGARLGVSRNMVKKYLVKALAHCRQRWKEPGRE
jgi:RNA polymerase sigma factor (sigma-70 family)